MSEDPTKELTTDEILRALLADVRTLMADMGEVKARLAIVEDRLKDTRPIWQAINTRTERIEEEMREVRKELRAIDRAFSTFSVDHLRMRADIRDFDERLTELERRPN